MHLAGTSFKGEKTTATFEVNPEQWVSTLKDVKSSLQTLPVFPVLATIQDSPRYTNGRKPIPGDRRYIFVSGCLTGVERNKDSTPMKFRVDVESIAFLGTATIIHKADNPSPGE